MERYALAVKKDYSVYRQLLGVYLGSCCLFARCSREGETPSQGGLEGLLFYTSYITRISLHVADRNKIIVVVGTIRC